MQPAYRCQFTHLLCQTWEMMILQCLALVQGTQCRVQAFSAPRARWMSDCTLQAVPLCTVVEARRFVQPIKPSGRARFPWHGESTRATLTLSPMSTISPATRANMYPVTGKEGKRAGQLAFTALRSVARSDQDENTERNVAGAMP